MARARFILFVVTNLLLVWSLAAHPPSSIALEFQPETGLLIIDIQHPTPDVQKHYINKVEILLNDRLVVSQEFFYQTDPEQQKAACIVHGAKPGDEILVIGYCNVFGKKKAAVTVPDGNK